MDTKRSLIRLAGGQRDASQELARSDAPAPALIRCAFCNAPHAAADVRNPAAVCAPCGSPLFPASEERPASDGVDRAFSRASWEMPMTFRLLCPQLVEFRGVTEDVSITGMRFRTNFQLLRDERLGIDCDFCAAVGDVRHVHRLTDALQPLWTVGVEFVTLWIKKPRGQFVDLKT